MSPAETGANAGNVALDLVRSTASNPDATALFYGGGDESWTYHRVRAEAGRVTSWLLETGVRPDDRVAILVGSWPEHVSAWYGALAVGAIVVDINYIVADEEWRHVIEDCRPSAIIGGAPFRDRLAPIAQDLGGVPVLWAEACGEGWLRVAAGSDEVEHRNATDVAVIAYTSGTSGLPKGVMHTHGLIGRQLELLAREQTYRATDVVYQAIPLFALQGFLPLVASAVRAGAAVLLADRFDPTELGRASRRFAITYLTLSSPMLDAILRLPEADRPVFPALRVLTCGGAPVQPEIRARFEQLVGVPISQGYGMTEMLGVMVVDYEADAPWGSAGRIRPRGSGDIVVLDDDGRILPAGEIGEFGLHRSCALAGYWGRPDLHDEAFTGDWFRTGDIGKIDAEGFFYVLDRKKDMIIRGGFNIYSAEVERVLSEHVDVAEVVVVGAPDDRVGEVPVAFVVPRDPNVEAAPLEEALLASALSRLGSLKAPVRVRVVGADDLPRNALRKVQKRVLRDSLRRCEAVDAGGR